MQNIIEQLMSNSPVTGLSVALIHEGKSEIFCQGDFEERSITEHTSWQVASLTKPIFAYGVLQLVQQGLLDLDRPLQSYLRKPYPESSDDLSQITARHILSHMSGLPNWRNSDGLKLVYPTGKHFNYSSEGLNYLQVVVEHLLNKSFADYLRDNVFIPFGMTQTELAEETPDTISPSISFILNTVPANGALSLKTTIVDYARFVQIMLQPPHHNDPYLSTETLAEMLFPQTKVGDIGNLYWGLGWGLQGSSGQSFWHWGARGIPTTMNFAMGLPAQNTAIVIFTNHREALYLCRDIIQSLFPTTSLSAFAWLLPAKSWRADGRKNS